MEIAQVRGQPVVSVDTSLITFRLAIARALVRWLPRVPVLPSQNNGPLHCGISATPRGLLNFE